MPELPEVEITTRKLKTLIIGKRILNFWTDYPAAILSSNPKLIFRDILNRKIESIERRGKAILLFLGGKRILELNQKMSGKILVIPSGLIDKHIHHRFLISGGKEIVFHDIRKFGRIWYGKTSEVLADRFFVKLGCDPLNISFSEFQKLLTFGQGMIKPLLLRQDIFSGIGNIIADESLWKAKIHPKTFIDNLSSQDKNQLYKALKFIIRKSIKLGGSSMQDWLHPDGKLGGYYPKRYVYNRAGNPCKRCRTLIEKIFLNSRGTFFCPKCQKLTGFKTKQCSV